MSAEEVTVRDAQQDDGPALAAVWLDYAGQHIAISRQRYIMPDARGLADWFAQRVRERTAAQLFAVAECGGAVTGILSAALRAPSETGARHISRLERSTYCYVNVVAVSKAMHRHGVGSALMAYAERWAIGNHAQAMMLDADIDNSAALDFYKANGFSRIAVILSKDLD